MTLSHTLYLTFKCPGRGISSATYTGNAFNIILMQRDRTSSPLPLPIYSFLCKSPRSFNLDTLYMRRALIVRIQKWKAFVHIICPYGKRTLMLLQSQQRKKKKKRESRFGGELVTLRDPSSVIMRQCCYSLILQLLISDTHIYMGVTHSSLPRAPVTAAAAAEERERI